MTGKLSININDRVSVELTAKGLEVLAKYWGQFGTSLPKKDLDGSTYTTQFWNLMEIFGPMTSHGSKQLFQHNLLTVEWV